MTYRCDQYDQRDRGVMTAMFAVLAIFFFLIVSVVAEGGRKLNNLSRAEDLAAEAARSAAATLDLDQIAQGTAAIDHVNGRAFHEASTIVATVNGAEIERFMVDNATVLVSVRVNGNSFLPGLNIDGVGSHQASVYDPFEP